MIGVIKTTGTSMSPIIKDGDYIFYEYPFKGLKKGDIVVYKYMDKRYIHRVYGFDGGKVVISNDDDLPYHTIDFNDIQGKVVLKNSFLNGFVLSKFMRFFRFLKWIYCQK